LVDHLDPFEAIVDCIIFGINRNKELGANIKYYSGQVEKFELINQSVFSTNPQFELSFSINDKIINEIEKNTDTLEKIVLINRGVNIGGCFEYFLSPNNNDGFYPYLGGTKNIKPFYYEIIEDDGYFKFDLNREEELRKNGATLVLGNPERYLIPHLFIPESGQSIMAAFCEKQIYGSYGLLIGTNPNNTELTKSACSLLNSKLISFYCIERGILRKGNKATPHVGVRGLNKVPIPHLKDENISLLSTFCDLITYAKKQKTDIWIEKLNDAIVYNLYFPDHMIEKGIDILKYVKQDILEATKEIEFNKLSNPEKENVLEKLHFKWSHPDNEVRNRILLFAVRSPDILKPILES
jgi:hypothetical protein